MIIRLLLVILLMGLAAPAPAQTSAQAPRRAAEPPAAITVDARVLPAFDPRHPELVRFEGLDFIGALELTSSHRDFGGLSSLRVAADGERFVAITDRARWLTGRIVYAEGRPAGIAEAVIAPILAADGRPLSAQGIYDSEALGGDGDTFYVAFERVHRLFRFDFKTAGVIARAEPVAAPPEFAKLPANKGIETLVVPPAGHRLAGTLIAIAERGPDRVADIKGWLIGGATPGTFSVMRRDDFDITDGAVLPSGDLVILERRFTWTSGVAVRLRRIAAAAIRPGARLDGRVLLTADMGYQIDNMEGLGVHRTAAGEVVLTLISDDNFSILQRTLLMQFKLVEE